jgi:2-haloacid dehalogenase/putative hydrolase of the HAD superfamily
MGAKELACQWGAKYFAAIEELNGHAFRTLADIERDTLIETIFPLTGRREVGSYIMRLHEYLIRPTLYKEVPDVLQRLSVPVCIVSNADERELHEACANLGLEFVYTVSSERARSYKPSPRIFEQALEITGWSAERVLHVGDSVHSDVEGAQGMGIKAAWVHRADRISDIGTAEADYTWQDLRPLAEISDLGSIQVPDRLQ